MDIDDLKCCGNCDRWDAEKNICPFETSTREGWEYCDNWVFDSFTIDQRKTEEYNGN